MTDRTKFTQLVKALPSDLRNTAIESQVSRDSNSYELDFVRYLNNTGADQDLRVEVFL
jgi:hypothetical protein